MTFYVKAKKHGVLNFYYCSFVWDNCTGSLKDRLQKLQNKVGRVITGYRYDASATISRNKLVCRRKILRRTKRYRQVLFHIFSIFQQYVNWNICLFAKHAMCPYSRRHGLLENQKT